MTPIPRFPPSRSVRPIRPVHLRRIHSNDNADARMAVESLQPTRRETVAMMVIIAVTVFLCFVPVAL